MTSKQALGKGLGALIPTGARGYSELDPGLIDPAPDQPRKAFNEEGIASLAASIRQVGVLQPLVVRPSVAGRYELVVGERRWRAVQVAGLRSVPALVIETDDRGALQRALVENLHRSDLNALEEAAGYQQMIAEAGLTHEEVAERVGLSRPAITNALRLLELPASVQVLLQEAKITAGHGRALLGAVEDADIAELAARVVAEGLSVRQTESLVRPHSAGNSGSARVSSPATPPAELLELQQRLSDELGTRVKIASRAKGPGRGRISIEFADANDLGRIYRLISPALRSRAGEMDGLE